MPIDAAIESAERMISIAWEAAAAAHEAGLPIADTLGHAAADLELHLKNLLVPPPEDSQASTVGFVRVMDAELRKPWVHAQRYQVVWSFSMCRRAQGIIRHLLAAVEVYGTETKTMAAGVDWLAEAERGPDVPR